MLAAIDAHDRPASGVCFSSDGLYLFSSSHDATVKQWLLEDSSLVRTFEGHWSAVFCVALSSDGMFLFSGSEDASVIQWGAGDAQII